MFSKSFKFYDSFSKFKILKSPLQFKPSFFKTRSTFQKVVNPKLIFDSEGKAIIFFHRNGESDLRWLVRGMVFFTMLNTFLAVSEYVKPVFGGWNGFSFTLTSLMGVGVLIAINILSKRVIKEIRLLKTGNFVELKFFNAFWMPQTKVYHISEFANLEPSYLMYYRTEITSLGKAWINIEKNAYEGLSEQESALENVLNGKIIKLNEVEKRARKYHK